MNNYSQLIKDLGVTLTLTKRLTSTYNTLSGTITKTTKNYTVKGYIYKGEDTSRTGDGFTQSYETVILSNKQTNGLTLPEPVSSDLILSSDTTYEILSSTSNSEKGIKMFYKCDLRG